jgi:hypothetical protein
MTENPPQVSPLPREFAVDPGPTGARLLTGSLVLLTLFGGLVAIELAAPGLGVALRVAGLAFAPLMVFALEGFLVAAMAYIAVVTFLAVPRMRFHVGARRFEVRTIFGDRHWPIAGLKARRHVPDFGLRLMGTSLSGYATGWFIVDRRRTRVYATSKDAGVLLEGPDIRLFVTPADAAGMVGALRLAGADVQDS